MMLIIISYVLCVYTKLGARHPIQTSAPRLRAKTKQIGVYSRVSQ